ncbi:acetyltransferase family protein [Mycobacterium kansasii]|uniref:Acetyltransferase family protein n=1 Tax=Mycobacterium kansasii TaxID=1768 RepID=A0A1V3WXA0_MYCKA|nr:acetyltransferase family protein [Mycobacterium kansasii]
MGIEIRVLDSEDDLVAAAGIFRAAMVGLPPPPDLPPGELTTLFEPGRTVGAFAGRQLVGTADAVTCGLTLPGGAVVRHAAVTHIGVLPSFTRRGIATELIRHQLHDIATRGEVVATLRASEATIYERFGYGVASSSQSVEVHTRRAALRPGVGAGGPVRLLDTAQAWDVLPRIYAGNRSSRPGTVERAPVWWRACGCAPKHTLGLGISRCTVSRGRSLASSATAPRHRKLVRQRTTHHRGRGLLRPIHGCLSGPAALSAGAGSH